jgi:hypothetical protein
MGFTPTPSWCSRRLSGRPAMRERAEGEFAARQDPRTTASGFIDQAAALIEILDTTEIIDTIYARRSPMIPASAGLQL